MSRFILSGVGRELVQQAVRGKPLLAFDFDGTLAPIVLVPDDARMADTTRRLLVRVARLFPCAVISGRARADVAKRSKGVPWVAVVGNHGIESAEGGRAVAPAVQRWRRVLEHQLAPVAGVWVEDKGHSLSVHYRGAAHKPRARRAILAALGTLRGTRVVSGKDVFNVVPRGAPNKGQAVVRLRRRLGCDRVLFVGDDVTDEDAFALAGPRFLAIRVGARRGSAAPHHLRSQAEIDDLLALLVEVGRRLQSAKRTSTRRSLAQVSSS